MSNVTETSRAAYHSHETKDSETLALARYIMNRSKHGQKTWIAIAARELNREKSSISGRMNDIKKIMESNGHIEIEGRKYELVKMAKSVRDPHTGKMADAYTMKLLPSVGIQHEMF